jgi:hypothetical protein
LLIYFALMAFLVYFHTLVLIPLLLQKKKVILYGSGIILLMIALHAVANAESALLG